MDYVLNYLSCLIIEYPILQIVFTGIVSGLVAFITVYLTSKYNKKQFKEECRLREENLTKEQNKYQNELKLRKYEKLLNDWDKLKLVDKMITILNERELDIENKPMVFTSITSESLTRGDIYNDVKILSVIARSLGINKFSLNTSDYVEYVLNFKFENSIEGKNISIYNEYSNTVYLSSLDYVQKYSFSEFILMNDENITNNEIIGRQLRVLMDLLNDENIFEDTYLEKLKCFFNITKEDNTFKFSLNINESLYMQDNIAFLISTLNEYIGHYSNVLNNTMISHKNKKEFTYEEYIKYSKYINSVNIINHVFHNFRFILSEDKNINNNTRFVFFEQLVSINEFREADVLILMKTEKMQKIIEIKKELDKKYNNCYVLDEVHSE